MRKSGTIFYFVAFFFALLFSSCGNKENTMQIQIRKLDNYPSASSVEYIDGKLYLMGDDATNFLVLDTNLTIIDSIPVITNPERRIPKETKPDLEASAFNNDSNEIFLFGSGSLSPYRNLAWRYNIQTRLKDSLSLEHLYTQVKNSGIEQVNIEGVCYSA